jgi:hypothetical protein
MPTISKQIQLGKLQAKKKSQREIKDAALAENAK